MLRRQTVHFIKPSATYRNPTRSSYPTLPLPARGSLNSTAHGISYLVVYLPKEGGRHANVGTYTHMSSIKPFYPTTRIVSCIVHPTVNGATVEAPSDLAPFHLPPSPSPPPTQSSRSQPSKVGVQQLI
jgi:hypothetical protein